MPESFAVAGFPLRRVLTAPLSRDVHVTTVGVPERFRAVAPSAPHRGEDSPAATDAVPIIEELIYRGLWWSALLKRGVSEGWTLVITSLAFAAAHFELERFPVLFVLGIALGVGRSLTGRIGASIIAHALINGIAMAVLLATI